ncbi:hypothetical protein OAE61_00765 [Verrucomicrobiales bacterium]|nr:hypothetical protein [Verrucomicrobiales bacterium]MDC0276505.1 hypothetical protein [Verrucomicrobiales bacterium]MDC0312005.1 hypothetical protein [bacterium]MDC0322023.1 hypothetical protein [Verrucomicrobiales bacterium]
MKCLADGTGNGIVLFDLTFFVIGSLFCKKALFTVAESVSEPAESIPALTFDCRKKYGFFQLLAHARCYV